MKTKAQIKEIFDYNIAKAICYQNHGIDGYYPYMLEVVLDHLRDVLVDEGVNSLKAELEALDAVRYYKSLSDYNFSTYKDEYRLKWSINKLRELIFTK